MKIYTKQGDRGQSTLFDGKRVAKDHPRLEAYGTLDELNAHLGLAIAATKQESLRELLQRLQFLIFEVCTDLATPLDSRNAAKIRRIDAGDVTFLEQQIDLATAQLPPLKRFILPGGGMAAAHLHVARTVCRRAERLLITLMSSPADLIGEQILIFVNRLSDLLFTLARLSNKLEGISDVEWMSGLDKEKAEKSNKSPG